MQEKDTIILSLLWLIKIRSEVSKYLTFQKSVCVHIQICINNIYLKKNKKTFSCNLLLYESSFFFSGIFCNIPLFLYKQNKNDSIAMRVIWSWSWGSGWVDRRSWRAAWRRNLVNSTLSSDMLMQYPRRTQRVWHHYTVSYS